MIVSEQKSTNRANISCCRSAAGWLKTLVPACGLGDLPVMMPCCQAQEPPGIRFGKVSPSAHPAKHSDSESAYRRSFEPGARPAGKRSDPEAGVQLLETIIRSVMNNPVVAIKKSSSQLAQVQNKQQLDSPTDFKLAIRPKESGKAFAIGPKSPLIIAQAPPMVEPNSLLAAGSKMKASQSPIESGVGNDRYGDEGTAENWKGSNFSRIAVKNEAASSQDADGWSSKPGLWESSRGQSAGGAGASSRTSRIAGLPSTNYGAYRAAPGDSVYSAPANFKLQHAAAPMAKTRAKTDSAAEERKVPDLPTAIGRFYKLNKTIADAQNMRRTLQEAQNMQPQPAPPLPPSLTQIASADKVAARAWPQSSKELAIADAAPTVRDYREAPLSTPGLNLQPPTSSDSSAAVRGKLMARKDGRDYPGSPRAGKPAKAEKKSSSTVRDFDNGFLSTESKPGRRERLALLPPNVATGIPGMNLNLGASEGQAAQALARTGGKLKMHKIKSWTVFSWTKRENDPDALQLYFRHGLLDAIRVFDSNNLISTGVGVSPGDQLEVVKERFGEPAFLLPEPGSEAPGRDLGGKNYIYPLSQVGFQLARPSGDLPPQVVSVLIFSLNH